LYGAVPAALALAAVGGFFLARKSLAPVAAMSARASQIGTENLDARLAVVNPRDELGRLAASFNDLLDRLNAAFSQQRQFMADASHELRTPLSVIRTAAGVTLSRSHRPEGEYREMVQTIGDQATRLTRIVEDMFTLARADMGRQPLRRTKFYVDELLSEVTRAALVLAGVKGISVDLTRPGEAPCEADEDLLRQMMLNLLDNAIKFTPTGGTVQVSLDRQNGSYHLTVSDSGSGIPLEAQPHIFRRFYRVDGARARDDSGCGSGAGLGLAIAHWIAEAHGGRLSLERSGEGGSTFLATFPAPPV
jgi:heavy metal sensor kinase